ncbi:MAG TPA: hypothetical protein VK988_22960 [Acidimicrobiales bacterium]|nr:hypothetical protein [Acidimicrobiales bacterium]
MAVLQRSRRTGFAAVLLVAVAVASSPALAASDTATIRTEVPPVKAVRQVELSPVTVPVGETPVDQVLHP